MAQQTVALEASKAPAAGEGPLPTAGFPTRGRPKPGKGRFIFLIKFKGNILSTEMRLLII